MLVAFLFWMDSVSSTDSIPSITQHYESLPRQSPVMGKRFPSGFP